MKRERGRKPKKKVCSFCGRGENEVKLLFLARVLRDKALA